MRLRDLQQILDRFTNGQKGTVISDCPVYIETMSEQIKMNYLDQEHINRVKGSLGNGVEARVEAPH